MNRRISQALVLGISTLSLFGAGAGTWYSSTTRIEGLASVIDGDTIRIHNERIRLSGIDAPEMTQTCRYRDVIWMCGVASRTSLDYMIGGSFVTCVNEGRDSYHRVLATCYDRNGKNINREMVTLGMALAYTRYSNQYAIDELIARKSSRGIWASTFTRPENYRHTKE